MSLQLKNEPKPTLLALLRRQDLASTAQLAASLGTTTELVEAQLERYAQLGFVKKTVQYGQNCGGGCKTCKGCSGQFGSAAPVVFWELTAAGGALQ